MSITPAELRHVRFAQVRRGYDTDAVDAAIESVADTIEALLHERHELVERVRALEAEVERYRDIEETLQQTIVLAERAAADLDEERSTTAPTSALPDPAFLELLGETRAIRSLLQALLTQAPGGDDGSGGTPFASRP